MSNIFFTEIDEIQVKYPEEWQDVSIAPILRKEKFRQIYVIRYKDVNGDNKTMEYWSINEDGNVVPSDRIELTEPFFVGNHTMKAISIYQNGDFINLQSTDYKTGTAIGFKCPDFSAADINGKC